MSGADAKLLGRWGEALVAEDLRRQGKQVVAAGYRSRFGEIDLIVTDEKYLIFTEVKLRKDGTFASGREAVDARKQGRLRATAEIYLSTHPEITLQPRFDVAEVYAPRGTLTCNPRIIYIENAF